MLKDKFHVKRTISSPFSISSLTSSKNKKKEMVIDRSLGSFHSNDKILTQCSSEIKEFKLEYFYKSESLENVMLFFKLVM